MYRSNFLIGFFLLFVVVSSLGYYGYNSIRNNLVQEQIELNIAETRALEARISRWLERRKTEISTLANTPVVRSMDWSKSGPFLKQKHVTMPWFYIFAHINPDGTYYNSKVDFAEGKNLSDRAHFLASIEGRVYASDPVVSRTLGTDIVAVTSPIYRTDETTSDIIGVFGGMIDTTTILEELARFENGKNSYAFALNSTGVVISHPDINRMGNINTKADSLTADQDPGLSTVAMKMLEGREGWQRLKIDGQDAFVTFTPVSQADWYLATVTDASHVNSQLKAVNFAAFFFAMVLMSTFYMVLRLRNSEAQRLETEKSVVEEKNRAKSNFLANVSHELRTPLNAVIGYSDLLQADKQLTPAARNRVEAINKSGKHLLSLINRILDLAKVEAGRLELDKRPVQVQALIRDTAKSLEIAAQRYPTTFSTSIEIPKDLRASVDTDKIIQVINNLTTNAFKYGGSGHVTLAAFIRQQTDGTATLNVNIVDQGIGMSPEEMAKVFNEFEQIDAKSSGLGLGLAIVKQLVNLMNGDIKISSEVGEGTSVIVELPLQLTDLENERAHDKKFDGSFMIDGMGYSVLVIDDNEDNSALMRDLYTSSNFKVTVARDGEAGLNLFHKHSFDLVLTDLVMPKKNGFDVIKTIRAHKTKSHVPIIVASASAFATDKSASLDAGANAFMAKPVDLKSVLRTTCQLLQIDITQLSNDPISLEAKLEADTLIKTESIILDQDDFKNASQLIELAEVGRLTEIKSLMNEAKSQGLKSLGALLEDDLENLDAEGVIKKVQLVLSKNGK